MAQAGDHFWVAVGSVFFAMICVLYTGRFFLFWARKRFIGVLFFCRCAVLPVACHEPVGGRARGGRARGGGWGGGILLCRRNQRLLLNGATVGTLNACVDFDNSSVNTRVELARGREGEL